MNHEAKEMEIADQVFGSHSDKIGDHKKSEMDSSITRCCNGDDQDENRSSDVAGYNREKPPEDDCCPICFGDFKVPCKANCGHWFCGGCILQLWEYRSRPGRCKCPFCSSPISKLTPQVSSANKTEDEACEVLQNIEHYNRFYVKGIQGCFLIFTFYLRKHGPLMHVYIWSLLRALAMIVINMPATVKRVFVDLIIHPERIRINYQRVRVIACTMTVFLHLYHGLLPPDLRLQLKKIKVWIDYASIILVILPYTIVLFKTWIHIWWLRFRIWQVRREVDALRAHNAALREQEAALQAQADALRVHEAVLEENAWLLQNNAALRAVVEAAQQDRGQHALPELIE